MGPLFIPRPIKIFWLVNLGKNTHQDTKVLKIVASKVLHADVSSQKGNDEVIRCSLQKSET